MPVMTIRISDEAWRHVQHRIGFRSRGKGAFVDALILQDAARRDERLLAQRRLEQGEQALSTRETWDRTGLHVD
jgi:hypothetical protein